MKPSTLVALRRKIGPWCTHSHPDPEEREKILEELAAPDRNFVRAWAAGLLDALEKEKSAAPPDAAEIGCRLPREKGEPTVDVI